jgi:hypothetical protein
MKYPRKIALVLAMCFFVGALAFGGWVLYRVNNVEFAYTWRIEYKKMPVDDMPLVDWLKTQPGVLNANVTRDGKFILVTYDLKSEHSTPNVIERADKLGYSERGDFFGDLHVQK